MAVSKYNDPAYWRARATETRQIAERFRDEKARAQMAEIAERYDRMVEMAEKLRLMNGNGNKR